MKITIKKILFFLVFMFVLISCTSCDSKNIGYYPRISRTDLKKVESITFSVDGIQYNYQSNDNETFPKISAQIEAMLRSGKFDISGLFTGKVKMPCTDEAVNNNKAAVDIWFEIFIDNGSYKKIFFTMNSNDTQSIWIYATSTDSYNDGKFLKYYSCDCKELLTLIDSYNAE